MILAAEIERGREGNGSDRVELLEAFIIFCQWTVKNWYLLRQTGNSYSVQVPSTENTIDGIIWFALQLSIVKKWGFGEMVTLKKNLSVKHGFH